MGTGLTLTATNTVTDLGSRAVLGTIIMVLLLIMAAGLFRRSDYAKRIIFILVVSVVLLTSTLLFMTALNNIQGYAAVVQSSGRRAC